MPLSSRSHAKNTLVFSLLVGAVIALPGCNDKDKPVAADPHAGQDHGSSGHEGHDHHNGGHEDEITLTPEAIERYGIRVEAAQLWRLRPTFSAPGRAAFNTEAMAHIGSPLKGRAVDIKVRLGDTVKLGDDLLTVESPELGEAQSDYLARRTAVQTAGPAVDLAKAAWERGKSVHEQSQGISLTEVQKREAEYKAALAAIKTAESAVAAAENRLRLLGMSQQSVSVLAASGTIAPRLVIHTPIAGQVIDRDVTLGELVSPEQEALIVVADVGTLWVHADVPEARLREVTKGAKCWITFGGLAGQRLEAAVSYISPTIDAATRTARVRIEVPGNDPALKPGAFVQVEIVAAVLGGEEPPPVIAVPQEVVQIVEGGPALFVPVKGEPNTFAKRAVTIGRAVGGLVPVHTGLVEGEDFVVAGSFILKAELGKGSAAHEH